MTDEAHAIRRLAEAARRFGGIKPRRLVTGAYAVALAELVDAARVFAARSDEEWADDVARALESRNGP